jgi:acetoacetate decarboxylase
MKKADILKLPSLPIVGHSYPRAPNRFINREYLNITYETDIEILRNVLPEPLEPQGNTIVFEVMKMPDSSGFGDYTESGLVIPALYKGEKVNFPLMMFLDDEPPMTGGREIWGFPKKYGAPKLEIVHDTLTGSLHYADHLVALGTMTYKQENLLVDDNMHAMRDPGAIRDKLGGKQICLKLIPDVTGGVAVAQLVSFNMIDIVVKGAWSGPARLHLVPHVNAPLADFPVRRVIGGVHYIADMSLPYGKVEVDYLKS